MHHLIARWAASLSPRLFLALLTVGCGGPPGGGDHGSGQTDSPGDGTHGAAETSGGDQGGEVNAFTFPEDADPALATRPFVHTELLVRTLPGADPDDLQAAYDDAGAIVLEDLPEIQMTVLAAEPGDLMTIAEELANNPLLEAVQKNYLYDPGQLPDDPEFASQPYLESVGLTQAWETTTGVENIAIAVLDSGVDPDHPDLAPKLAIGWNTFDRNGETRDVSGHGTTVAGAAAAASDNGLGIAGVSWESPILPVRVTNTEGLASTRAIASGLIWSINHGATVINVSFAPLGSDRTVLRAAQHVRSAGGLVFVSAGNEGQSSTAAANANAIFVGATDASNQLASFSTFGPFVDLLAPGTGIRTTSLGGGYLTVNGTSYSSPIVAGVAALVWSVRPELRPATVQDILVQTAVDLDPPGQDGGYGTGLIDAAAAVGQALDIVEQDDLTAPVAEITRPDDGESLSGIFRIEVRATDDGGVADVVLSIDGQPFATDAAEPYRFSVNTGRLANGTHTLTCVATDEAGNAAAPASVHINVGEEMQDNGSTETDTIAPSVVINFPVDGRGVSDSVGIRATATDNVELARAEWLVDGTVKETTTISGTQSVLDFVWDAGGYTPGAHTIGVLVADSSNNRAVASISLVKQ